MTEHTTQPSPIKTGTMQDDADHSSVARGTGLAFLGRMGALVEAVSFVAFAKLYGPVNFGFFVLLWSYVHVASIVSDFGMTSALQRFAPLQTSRDGTHKVLRNAIMVSLPISLAFAALLFVLAPMAADVLQTDEMPTPTLTAIIRIYVWAIPLWTFIDVATAAIRAQRVFGPEIKVRVFYEQILRLVAGILFFYIGWTTFGLFAAHLASFAITVLLSIRLLRRHYRLSRIIWPAHKRDHIRIPTMVRFGSSMILPNVSKKLHAYLPIYILKFAIPGATGISIVAVYAMARKIVSVLQVIRDSFEYVLAPVASAKKGAASYESLGDIYAFATRFICASFIPAATIILVFGSDLLATAGPEFVAGFTALAILVAGRLVEASTGPSSAIISMIGRYRLPLFNALAGISATGLLLLFLAPPFGIEGAAVAAAVGINVTSIAALTQVHIYHDLRAFNRRLLRPVLISLMLSILMAGMILLAAKIHIIVKIVAGVLGLATALLLLLRYGFDERDLAALLPNGKPELLARLTNRQKKPT
ncbi:MAG: oligosaccharide flippase family protein [Sphingomonadales bacterium]